MSKPGAQRFPAFQWPGKDAHQRASADIARKTASDDANLGAETSGWPKTKNRVKASKKVRTKLEEMARDVDDNEGCGRGER